MDVKICIYHLLYVPATLTALDQRKLCVSLLTEFRDLLKLACYTPAFRINAKYSTCPRIVLNNRFFCSEPIDFDDETGLW